MVDAPGLPQDPLQVRLWPFLQLARRFEVNRITNSVDRTFFTPMRLEQGY